MRGKPRYKQRQPTARDTVRNYWPMAVCRKTDNGFRVFALAKGSSNYTGERSTAQAAWKCAARELTER